MRSMLLIVAILGLSVPAMSLEYGQNVTPEVIFGAGNVNGSFTVGTVDMPLYSAEIGLRAKVRFNESGLPENTFNNFEENRYFFLAGVGTGQSFPTPTWGFEWTVNVDVNGSGNVTLDDFEYELGLDYDPLPAGTNFVAFDPIAVSPEAPFWDHAMGDNSTANGGGVTATNATEYLNYLAQYNVAQQSWRYSWFDAFGTFDPNEIGVYDIYLKLISSGTVVAETSIQVFVGDTIGNEDASWGEIKSLYR